MWDRRVFKRVDSVVGSFSISVMLKGVSDRFEWICSGVYGPTDGSLRDAMWGRIRLSEITVGWGLVLVGRFQCYPLAD